MNIDDIRLIIDCEIMSRVVIGNAIGNSTSSFPVGIFL